MSANVAQLFLESARRNGDRPAFLSSTSDRITFGELRARVDAFAGWLMDHGVGPGDRAVFMLPMSIDLYVAVLGTLSAGGVAVFVDPWVPMREIARMAVMARPVVFVGTPQAHLMRLFARELRSVRLAITTGGRLSRFAVRFRLSELRGRAGSPHVADVSPDAPALITYTSGSSGAPKGVNRTHDILAAQHAVIREEFPADANDVDLTTFPVFALSNVAAGITTVIPPVNLRRIAAADPRLLLTDIRRFAVSTAAASPPLFDVLSDYLRGSGEAPPRLRRIVTGGAPVRDDQLRRWRDTWPHTEIVIAFGSSEAEPVASMSADERLKASHGGPGFCVGTPVRSVRAKVIRITRTSVDRVAEAPRGTIGELVVSGPHVCRDYAGDERAFAENKIRDTDGTIWHRMGDTGCFDDAGRFWLVGRVHSTIRRDGVDLHAQVIESVARGGDARIRRVAALGIPDPVLGERLAIIVESDADDVRADLEARLAAAHPPVPVDQLIVTRSKLPVDPRHNSKVDYARLHRMLQAGALS